MSNHPILLDSRDGVARQGDDLFFTTEQEIPDFFLDDLAESRLASKTERCGEFHKVASIPVGIINTMYRRGMDFARMSPNDILKWLRQNGYERLIATSKNITFQEN